MKSKHATIIISDSFWTELEEDFDILSWSVYSDVAIYVQEYGLTGWGSSVSVSANTSDYYSTSISKIRIKSQLGSATVNYSLIGFICFKLNAGLQLPIRTVSSNATLTVSDYTILLYGLNNLVTLTLPSAVGIEGKLFNIKCINATYTCDVETNASETIDEDSSNFELILDESIAIQSDGIGWRIL